MSEQPQLPHNNLAPVTEPSPEQPISPHEAQVERLRDSPVVSEVVLANGAFAVDTELPPLAIADNDAQGVRQTLHAVVRADEALFGLISVESQRDKSNKIYLLSQIGDSSARGSVVGAISPVSPLLVGREFQPELKDKDGVSRRHFKAATSQWGVEIEDLGSANKTEVFVHNGRAEQQAQVSPEHSVALGGALKVLETARNPITDLSWAPKSAVVAELLVQAERQAALATVKAALNLPDDLEVEIELKGMTAVIDAYKSAEAIIEKGDTAQIDVVKELVTEGTFKGKELPETLGKWKLGDTEAKIAQLLKIYNRDPKAAETIIDTRVAGFHGSSSVSLLGVLKHGLLSAGEARKRNIRLDSGERTYSGVNGQGTISFADWRKPHTIAYYSDGSSGVNEPNSLRESAASLRVGAQENADLWGMDHPFAHNGFSSADSMEALADHIEALPQDSEEALLLRDNFPVAYGLNIDDYHIYDTVWDSKQSTEVPEKALISRMTSDVGGEFQVLGGRISFEDMPVIAVPTAQVARVQKILEQHGHADMIVLPLESIIEKERKDPFIA